MEDEQDVRTMTEFINKQKSYQSSNYEFEFHDFLMFKDDDEDFDEDDEYVEENESIQHYQEENIDFSACALTEEEQRIIDSTTDPDLKQLLILNRSKNLQLIKLYKKMQTLLLECEEEIEIKISVLRDKVPKTLAQQTYVWKLSAPYFKDKKFFSCPLNKDAMKKRSENELSFYDLVQSPKWTPIEFDRLTNAVKCNYNINKQTEVASRLNALKAKVQNDEDIDKNKIDEIVKLEEHLEDLKINDERIPPLNSNEFIDWYKVSETFLKDKHTPLECQSVWHMIVHPDINKSEWTEEENKKLETIAREHSFENWDEIAAELETNRTGFTTCLHYFSKLCDKFKKSKFTSEEDNFLLEVVASYKVGNFIPWNKVVCHFSHRSRHQLYHRYTYFLSHENVKKGKFSEAEDILLLILVNKFGRNFKKCTEYMPHRSQVQLKSRYNSNLQRNIKKGTFTSEDDEFIYKYVTENGEKNWSKIAQKLNRCNAQIRQRYKLIKSFLNDNPNALIKNIPKRKHRLNEISEDQYNFLNYMADQYKNRETIPTLSMIEESLEAELRGTSKPSYIRVKKTAKLKNVDAMLTDFFTSSMKIKISNNMTETNLNEGVENAEEILASLGATLDIPGGLQCDSYLDNVDLEILDRLSKKNIDNEPKIDHLVPPNISTLVGLRSLIIKHKEYKTQQKEKKMDTWIAVDRNLLQLDESTRREILFHRDLFSKRFDALYDWSAILSLEKPNLFEIPEENNVSQNNVATISRKTYSRNPRQEENVLVKRRKIDISTLTQQLNQNPEISQLKVVDKSVVEKLMKQNSNINIIKITTVPTLNGPINTVISQNYGSSEPEMAGPMETDDVNVTNISEEVVEEDVDEDIEDVQRLNGILDSIKCEGEEFQAMEGDVQLLTEILKYEKTRIKSDPDCV